MLPLFSKMMKYAVVCTGHLIPAYKRCVLFCSFQGMYSDNPKVISEKLHEIAPDLPIYWAVSEKCRDTVPDYVHKVPYDTPLYWGLIVFSRVAVDTGLGMRRGYVKKGTLKSSIFQFYCKKRKGQLCISTWHGTPFKKIGMDFKRFWMEENRGITVSCSCSDYVLAGCEYTKEKLLSATSNKIPVKMYGTPRNDILFKENIDVIQLKRKLHLPEDKKVILFAPTWRPYSINLGGSEQLETLHIEDLLQKLGERFGGDFVFAFRVHPLVLLDINNKNLLEKYGDTVVDGNLGDDMADYLVCADALITDYSSSMFDFALTGKPCFLYVPDKEQFDKSTGTYLEYDQLPFPKAYTPQELTDCAINFDEALYRKKVGAFLEELGDIEDGHATERVVQDIIDFIGTGKKG